MLERLPSNLSSAIFSFLAATSVLGRCYRVNRYMQFIASQPSSCGAWYHWDEASLTGMATVAPLWLPSLSTMRCCITMVAVHHQLHRYLSAVIALPESLRRLRSVTIRSEKDPVHDCDDEIMMGRERKRKRKTIRRVVRMG